MCIRDRRGVQPVLLIVAQDTQVAGKAAAGLIHAADAQTQPVIFHTHLIGQRTQRTGYAQCAQHQEQLSDGVAGRFGIGRVAGHTRRGKQHQAILHLRLHLNAVSYTHLVHAYDALKREEERLLESGFMTRASQNSQVWQAVLRLIDQLVKLSGGARIPLKHIASRLECGLSAISLKSLPPAAGMVHAGALGHLLAEEADAVFPVSYTHLRPAMRPASLVAWR